MFKWAILASHDGSHAERISELLQYEKIFDWNELHFPVCIHDIHTVEIHTTNVSLNVYALDGDTDEDIYPVRVVDQEKLLHFDLLLIQHENNFHYTYIKSFSCMFASRTNGHEHSLHYCKRCLVHFYNAQDLSEHGKECKKYPVAWIRMPKPRYYFSKQDQDRISEEPSIKFRNSERGGPVRFVIHGDFESVLIPEEGCINDPEISFKLKFQSHQPMSYCLYVVST